MTPEASTPPLRDPPDDSRTSQEKFWESLDELYFNYPDPRHLRILTSHLMATWQGLATPPPCVPEMPIGVSAVEGTVVLNVHEEPIDSPWQWAVQQMAPGLTDIEESRPEYYNARTALWDIRSNECASACLGESFSPVDTTAYKAEAKWSGGPPPTVKPPPIPPGVSMSCVLTQGGLQILQGPHSIFDDPEDAFQEAQMSQPPEVSVMQPLLFPVPQRDPAMQVNRENDGSSAEPPPKKAKTSEEEPPIAEPMPPIDDELGYVESVLSSRLRRVQMDKGRLIAGVIDTIHRLDRKMNWEWREVVEQRMIQQYKQEFIEERLSAREAYRLARQARDLLGFRMLCRDANCLPALWVEQALCFVCGQADEYDADPIVFCDGCFVPTHLTCVGCPPPRSKKGRKQAKKLLSRSGRKDQKSRVVRQSSSNSNGDEDEWYCCVCRLVMSQMPPSMPKYKMVRFIRRLAGPKSVADKQKSLNGAMPYFNARDIAWLGIDQNLEWRIPISKDPPKLKPKKREDGGYTPSNSTDMKMESSTPTSIKYDAKSGLQEMPVKETPIDHRSSGELDSSYQTLDSGDLHQGMKTPPNEDSMPLMTPDPNSPHAQIIQSLLRSPSFLSMSPISQLHMALLHGGDYLPDSDISRLLRASTDDPEICALTPAEVRQAFQVKRSRGRPPNSVAAFHRLVNLLREARERRPRGRPSSRDKQQHPLLPFLPKEILPPNYVAQFPPASRVAPPPYVRAKSSGRRSKNSQIYPSRWHTYWQISLSDNEDEVEVKQEDSPKDSEIARIVTKREDGVIIKEVELHVPLCRLCGFDAFHVGAGPVLPWYSPLGGPGAFGGFGGKKAYVHIRCALGLHGVLDVNSKGIRLPKPDQERLSMSCLKCRRKGLYPVQCAHPDCYVALHVGCATASPDCRTEWRIEGPQVFCPRHSEMDAPTPQLKVYLQNKKLKMPGMLVSSIWPPSSTTDPVVQGNPQLALLYCIANQCLVGPSAASLLMNRTDNKKDIRAVEPIAFRGWSSATITSFAPDTPLAQRQRVIERIQRLLVYPEGLARIAEWAVQDGTRIGIQRVLRESEARLFDEKPPPNSNRFVAYAWEVMIQLWLLSGGQAADDLPLMLLALAKYGGFLPNSAPVPSLPPWSSIVTHCFGCGIPGVCFDTQKRGLVTDVSVLLVLPCSVCNITLCRNCVEAWEGPEAASVWDSCCEAQTFLCGRCRFSSFANCVLCPRRDGWLIPIDDDEWIHPQCYDCVVPVKSRQSAPTILAATQKAENVGTMCSICGLSVGATVKCGFPDCPVRFHYTCAALMGSRCDEKDSYQCLLHSALLNPEHHQMDHLVSSPLDDLLQLEGGRWSLGGISTLIKFDMSYRLKEVGKNPVDLAVAFIEGLGLKLQPPLHWSVREPEDELAEELANMHL